MKELFNWDRPYLSTVHEGIRKWIVLANIITVNMLAIVSSIGGVVVNSNIQGTLVIGDTETLWIGLIFLILVGATVPIATFAAERYGYKRTLFVGVAIFMLGSALQGFSVNYAELILFRAISGIGAGIIFPLSLTIITKTFDKKQVGLALSLYVALAFGLGIAQGFLIGGYFGEHNHWEMVFLLDAVSGPLNLLLTWLLQVETSKNTSLRFDLKGYLCFIIFLAALLSMINNAKAPWNTEGWTSNFMVGCIFIGILSFLLFLYYELKVDNPVFTLRLFETSSHAIGCFSLLLIGALLFGTANTFSTMLEHNLLFSKDRIGLILAPFGISFGITGACSSYLTQFFNIRLIAISGMAIIAGTCFLNHFITIQSDHFDIIGLMVMRGIGLGLSLGPLTAISLSSLAPGDFPQGSVAVTIFRQVGGALGGSILYLIQAFREVFHMERFSEEINMNAPRLQQSLNETAQHIINTTGVSYLEAKETAIQLLIIDAQSQAAIIGLNDAYFVFGYILLFCIAFVCVRMVLEWKQQKSHLQNKS